MNAVAMLDGSRIGSRRSALPAHFPALDGLRGIAIAMVMAFHFTTGAPAQSSIGLVILRIMGVGWAGVTLFFVLSGFLITGILLDTRGSSNYFVAFYARRTLRIFPLYYGALAGVVLVTFFVRLAGANLPPTHGMMWLWTYTSDIPQTFTSIPFPENPLFSFTHFWSLAVEEQFYLFWPLVILFCGRRTLLAVIFASLPIAVLSRYALMSGANGSTNEPEFFIASRIDALCAGALIAVLIRSNFSPKDVARYFRPLGILCLLILPFLLFAKQLHHPKMVQLFRQTVLGVFSASILAITIAQTNTSLLHRILCWRPLRLLGKYSYGIYVFHLLLLPLMFRWFPRSSLGPAGMPLIGDMVFVMIASAMTLCMAFISWHGFEMHFLRFKRYFEYRHDEPAQRPIGQSAAVGTAPVGS